MSDQPSRAKTRADVARRHRKGLGDLQKDPRGRRTQLETMVGRRSRGRRLGDLGIGGDGDRVTPQRPGRLVARADDATETILELSTAAGATAAPVECLRGRVVAIDATALIRARPARRCSRASTPPVSSPPPSPSPRPGSSMKSVVSPVRPVDGETIPTRVEVGERSLPVVVIDNGVNTEDRTDGWLHGLQQTDNRDPLDEWPEENDLLDVAAGHGTFVAGIVQQVDPALDLSVVRAVDSDGLGDEIEVACAIVTAVEERLTEGGRLVLNLSLGAETVDDRPPVALQVALEILREVEAERHGEVLLVAAAGNDGSETPCWPAAFAQTDPRVVAVAALGLDGAPAPWSTRGAWVTCSALGETVLSTFVTGTEDEDLVPRGAVDSFGTDAWAYWTGTSFAAPYVAARIASRARTSGGSLTDALADVLASAPGTAPGYGRLLPVT